MAMRIISPSDTDLSTTYSWISESFGVTNRKSIGLFLAFDWTDTAHTVTLKFQSESDGVWYDIQGVTSGTAALDTVTTASIGADTNMTISVDVQHHDEIRVLAKASAMSGTATTLDAKVFYGDLTV